VRNYYKYVMIIFVMIFEFQGVGWKSKLTQKRETMSLSISKIIVIGNNLKKGKILYNYLAFDKLKRPVIITYLDGKEIMN